MEIEKLPIEFVNRMKEQLAEEAEAFFMSYSEPYVKSLRFRTGPGKLAFIKQESKVSWEPKGRYYSDDDEAPGKSPLHAAGAYYIQEASAMFPVTLLNIKGSMIVLDLCAAPGGKTTQIADYMNGEGILVCNEIVPNRAKILSENVERMGVTNAMVISHEPQSLVGKFPRFFDRILVDAPCSGEGMFRKHPESRQEWSPENVQICADRQDMILDCASQMLAPGGLIVYSTCTFAPDEDEGSVERFLENHPDFVQLGKGHRIFPHKDRGEGHFAAVLAHKLYDPGVVVVTKESKEPDNNKQKGKVNNRSAAKGGIVQADKVTLQIFHDFCKENLTACKTLGVNNFENDKIPENIEKRICMFGDRMFLVPVNMPDIMGMTVLRPGLHLGTIVKGRFEPAHAFARAIEMPEAKRSIDFPSDSNEVRDYLKGMTISYGGGKGWSLIGTDGWPLGWGKCNGGIIKNHYPKGLRVLG